MRNALPQASSKYLGRHTHSIRAKRFVGQQCLLTRLPPATDTEQARRRYEANRLIELSDILRHKVIPDESLDFHVMSDSVNNRTVIVSHSSDEQGSL